MPVTKVDQSHVPTYNRGASPRVQEICPDLTSIATRSRYAETDWLGLGQACRLLGVNESTLRRWADAGTVRSFRTPGGHRRFPRAELRRLMAPLPAAGDRPPLDGEALQHIRALLDRRDHDPQPWLDPLTVETRGTLGRLGRRTLELVSRSAHPDADADADADALAPDAAALGREYGRILRGAGLSLSDAVSAFAYFRHGMAEAVTAHAQALRLPTDAAADLSERVSVLEDQVLVALAGEYERETPLAEPAPLPER